MDIKWNRLNKRNVSTYCSHFRRVLVLPVLITTFFVVFNIMNNSTYPPRMHQPSINGFQYLDPIYRSLLHVDQEHFIDNVSSMFLFMITLGFFIRDKFLSIIYLLLFLCSYLTILFVVNGVGSSIFVYGIYATLLTVTIYVCKRCFFVVREYEVTRLEILTLIFFMILIAVCNILILRYVIVDFLIAFGVDTVVNRGFTTHLVSDLPKEYKYDSAVGHSVGFTFGIAISVITFLLKFRFDIDLISRYFSKNN